MRQTGTVAYDYKAQRWVEGAAARDLLVAQLTETLECLAGPSGADYLAFTRRNGDTARTVAEAVADVRRQLAAL